MDKKDIETKLIEEKKKLEGELSKIAIKDPNNPNNWDATSGVQDGSPEADENVAADSIEDYEENIAITNSLEGRLQDVARAIDKLENNTYGKCEICGKDIEADRLEANPASRTCKTHINSL